MNFSEGVRRLFVVFQWTAVVLVLAAGWGARPQPAEQENWSVPAGTRVVLVDHDPFAVKATPAPAPMVPPSKPTYVTDPILLARLNAPEPPATMSLQEAARIVAARIAAGEALPRPPVVASAPEPDYVTDPVLIARLNAAATAQAQPMSAPTLEDWIKHIGLVAFSAVLAYYLVCAARKLLVWVCSGFVATSRRG
jgi:hypothetical protein